MRTSYLAVLVALVPCGAGAQEASAPDVVDAFHRALAQQDSAAVVGYLAQDVRIFESGGVERSRDEYAGHHLGADMAFAAGTRRTVTSRTHHVFDDVVVVMSESHTTGVLREREIDSRGVETMVLRRGADGWRIMHIHWSSRR